MNKAHNQHWKCTHCGLPFLPTVSNRLPRIGEHFTHSLDEDYIRFMTASSYLFDHKPSNYTILALDRDFPVLTTSQQELADLP